MEKTESMKNKRRLFIRAAVVLLLIFSAQILFITHGEYLYGNDFDWSIQHVELPSYMRQLFYQTGKFFPDFAMNLGAGQNIYYIAYYGLFSPIVLFSYLLPFVPMTAYMTGASIVLTALSVILLLCWLNRHLPFWPAFAGALLFTLALPVMYHSHHHLMFVNYLPFMILAMEGVEKYVQERKCLQLVLSVFLIILCSYFFSVGAGICLCLYGLYLYLESEHRKSVRDFLRKAAGFLGLLIIAILMAAVLWLPVLHVILEGRADTSVSVTMKDLLLPQFQAKSFLYGTSGMGLTAVFVLCISGCLISRSTGKKIVGIFSLLLMFFGLPVYLMNGGMYVDGKVLIPFLPFAALLFGGFLKDTAEHAWRLRNFLPLSIIIGALAVLTWQSGAGKRYFFIADFLVSLALIVILYKFSGREGKSSNGKKREVLKRSNGENREVQKQSIGENREVLKRSIGENREVLKQSNGKKRDVLKRSIGKKQDVLKRTLTVLLLLPALVLCFCVNSSDTLLRTDENPRTIYGQDPSALLQIAQKRENPEGGLVRTDLMYQRAGTTNYVLNPEQMRSGIYSSLNNQNYHNYYFKQAGNEITSHSNAIIKPVKNPLYDIQMGIRYIIGYRWRQPAPGYHTVAVKGDLALYENKNVLPIGYTSSGEEKFHPRVTSLSGKAVTETLSSLKGVRQKGSRLLVHRKKEKTVNIPVTPSSKTRILQLTMHVDNSSYRKKRSTGIRKGEIHISVNGVENVLSSPNWKYANNNNTFHFTLMIGPGTDHLTMRIGHGRYTISNIRIKTWHYQQYLNWRKTLSSWQMHRESDNVLTGKIKVAKSGNMRVSIPYDEGFSAYVDGKTAKIRKTAEGFLSIPVSRGTHEVRLEFHAPGKKTGMAVSAAGILLLVLVWRLNAVFVDSHRHEPGSVTNG